VTLTKAEQIIAQIRFKGGVYARTLTLPKPLSAGRNARPIPMVIRQIDQLLDTCTRGPDREPN